jgi:hypothetical protein
MRFSVFIKTAAFGCISEIRVRTVEKKSASVGLRLNPRLPIMISDHDKCIRLLHSRISPGTGVRCEKGGRDHGIAARGRGQIAEM